MNFEGINTIRFLASLWVMFGHQGFFPIAYGLDRSDPVARVIQGVLNNLICGPAAVIVFFVISGFCIHLPFRKDHQLNIKKFLARRYFRIGLPWIGLVVMTQLLLGRESAVAYSRLYDGIFWSLFAELVYYTLYPLLLRLRRRIAFEQMIVFSFILALGIAATNPKAGNYPSYEL